MKKTLSAILAGTLTAAMLLTGCGSSASSSTETKAAETSEAAAEESSSEAASDTASSDDAEIWTKDNITIVVPSKAGGLNDSIARLMQEYFQNEFNATFVIANYDTKAVAYEALKSAKNDGTTLMLQHSSLFAEAAGGSVAYEPTEELTVVGEINSLGGSAFIAPKDAPYDTFSELIGYAKANPGKVSAAYSAKGMSHFQWAAIEKAAGVDFNLVDASSESEKLTNVAGGFIGLAGVTYKSAKEYADAGQLKILSVCNNDEAADEFGYEKMEDLGYTTMAVNYMYIWAPKDMDPALAQQINNCFCKMTEDDDFKSKMDTLGYPAITTSLEDAQANAKAEMTAAYDLAKDIGL